MSNNPEDVEAHYRTSLFVKDVCVMGVAEPGPPPGVRRYAVVVPDLALMRARKIVNIGDLLRFEIEGLSHMLPGDARVSGYEIWFEPLPRTATQAIDRGEVERRVHERQRAARNPGPLPEADRAWLNQPHAAALLPLIQARARSGRVRPDANLEIDLGLDSMDRVELMVEIERRLGVALPPARAAEIYTVRQLVEAVIDKPEGVIDKPEGLSPQGQGSGQGQGSAPWAVILRDLPDLGWLLRRRLAAPLLWVLLRLVRWLFVRVNVTGLDKLPAAGPYIITPNHQSYVDPFILCSVLPFRIFTQIFLVGAVEYFETPLTRWVARTVNLVPVDPDSHLVPAMRAAAFGLSRGRILLLFPEGERSLDGEVKKFKKGAVVLAQHLGVPVVPVAMNGIHELWPRTRGINWRLVAPWSGHRVRIDIGEPFTIPAATDYQASAAQLRARVSEMWAALSP